MASCSVSEMRDIISKVYKGPAWKEKVRSMPDNQVIAVYYSFCEKGKFDKPAKKSELPNKPRERFKVTDYYNPDTGEQLSFDI